MEFRYKGRILVFPVNAYKVQYKENAATTFEDAGDWTTCARCMATMRRLIAEDYRREIRVVDDHGTIIASTERLSPCRPPVRGYAPHG